MLMNRFVANESGKGFSECDSYVGIVSDLYVGMWILCESYVNRMWMYKIHTMNGNSLWEQLDKQEKFGIQWSANRHWRDAPPIVDNESDRQIAEFESC